MREISRSASASDYSAQCIQLKSTWAKGYLRKGAALHGLRRFDEAIEAYQAGIQLEDSPAMRKGLQEVKDAQGESLFHVFLMLDFMSHKISHSNCYRW